MVAARIEAVPVQRACRWPGCARSATIPPVCRAHVRAMRGVGGRYTWRHCQGRPSSPSHTALGVPFPACPPPCCPSIRQPLLSSPARLPLCCCWRQALVCALLAGDARAVDALGGVLQSLQLPAILSTIGAFAFAPCALRCAARRCGRCWCVARTPTARSPPPAPNTHTYRIHEAHPPLTTTTLPNPQRTPCGPSCPPHRRHDHADAYNSPLSPPLPPQSPPFPFPLPRLPSEDFMWAKLALVGGAQQQQPAQVRVRAAACGAPGGGWVRGAGRGGGGQAGRAGERREGGRAAPCAKWPQSGQRWPRGRRASLAAWRPWPWARHAILAVAAHRTPYTPNTVHHTPYTPYTPYTVHPNPKHTHMRHPCCHAHQQWSPTPTPPLCCCPAAHPNLPPLPPVASAAAGRGRRRCVALVRRAALVLERRRRRRGRAGWLQPGRPPGRHQPLAAAVLQVGGVDDVWLASSSPAHLPSPPPRA